MIATEHIDFQTRGNGEMTDLTAKVAAALDRSEMEAGVVVVFASGATGAVTTIEYEPGLVEDMLGALERIAPHDIEYAHNRRWGDGNGHSHIRASVIGPSLTVPFADGKLLLGTWQQIVFLDLDNRPRYRRVVVQIMGE
ncbi:MAG TPA: secondary thiamine-phosphate synthase enzyme YjbQ [Methanothrix sp.]|mgnify:CR=1 FL=1|nr:secondary thiamine-phosphate synthase enzyme YjbQ [Methanothrix sp.]